jgi:hypothetical protein
MTPAAKNAALLVLGLGGAYGVYRYVYVPWKVKQEILRQAALLAAQRGVSQADGLALLGNIGCQAIGATYGVPPQASGSLCSQAGQMVSALAQQLPQILTGLGTGAAGLGTGVASGATALGNVPTNIVGHAASSVWSGVTTVAHDIAPWNWFGGGGINCSVAQKKPNAMWCLAKYPGTEAQRAVLDRGQY